MTPPDLTIPPPSRLSSWSWVVVVLVVTALAGQFLGVGGAALVFSASLAAAIGRYGELLFGPGRARTATVVALVVSAGVLLVLLVQAGTPWLRSLPTSSSTSPAAGRIVGSSEVDRVAVPGAQLAGSTLARLDLRDRVLDGARAPGASFAGADLTRASLRGVDLRGADLRDACLTDVDLAGARLDGADVTRASLPLDALTLGPTVGTPLAPGATAAGCRKP